MLIIENLKKQWGEQILFAEAEMSVYIGERVGVVGPNGAGKTTLFRMILGQEHPDSGKVELEDWATVDVLSQDSQCRLGVTVREEMMSAFPEMDAAAEQIAALSQNLDNDTSSFENREALRQLSKAQTALEMQEAHTVERRIGRVLSGLGFEKDAMDRMTDEFSGGWQMRIAMAKILLREPDLLLLDEPTNHLDSAAVKWLLKYLEDYHGAVLVISHEPAFLNKIVERIIEVDKGKLTAYAGNYFQYTEQKATNLENQQKQYDAQQKEIERQQVFINSMGAKASKGVAGAEPRQDAGQDGARRGSHYALSRDGLHVPRGAKPAIDALRLKNTTKSYTSASGSERVVLDNVDFKLKRGDRIALLGPNGAGKSTLLRLLAGIEPPNKGEREEGRNVLIGYFAQHQAEALDPDRGVLDEVLLGLEERPEEKARGLLGRLQIRGDQVFKPISVLSGGEKSRVALAKFLMQPANTLILDEPTNHLDPSSRQVLQDAVSKFEGAVVVASHDLPFVTAIATEAYRLEDGRLHEEKEFVKPAGQNGKHGKKK
jgi:ATP-binding cassette subfamily F protein 3